MSATGVPATATWDTASSRPAAKLASWQHRLVEGARHCVAMLQYPAAALCTEL
jgi:hypothetical protein